MILFLKSHINVVKTVFLLYDGIIYHTLFQANVLSILVLTGKHIPLTILLRACVADMSHNYSSLFLGKIPIEGLLLSLVFDAPTPCCVDPSGFLMVTFL